MVRNVYFGYKTDTLELEHFSLWCGFSRLG